jgi:hypothetical protein
MTEESCLYERLVSFCLFRHSEKKMKIGFALCVMVINHLLDNAALKSTRQRFDCLL